MKLFGYTFFEGKAKITKEPEAYTRPAMDYGNSVTITKEPEAYTRPAMDYGNSVTSWSFNIFNGEKSIGGIGPVEENSIDGKALRVRGWDAYLKNETVQTIITKSVKWIIGKGLRLQSELCVPVLNSEGITITEDQAQDLSDFIEARFSLFKEQKFSSNTKERNLSQLEAIAYRNGEIGGDVLVVIIFNGQYPCIKLIDGAHVKSPQGGDDWNPRDMGNGHRMINGVEMNEDGEHVAYHVLQADMTYKRIEAYSKSTGLRIAYLVGGIEYRLDYARCMPAISGILEVLATMDRYKIATLETAEETSKQAFQLVHGVTSTGESVLAKQIASARDADGNTGKIPVDKQLEVMADKVAVTTGKQAYNMPIDSEIKPIEKNKGELYFKDFYSMFFDIVCAALNVPPNVAMSKYDSNFSAARAAIKDWEHTLLIKRYNFSLAFLQPIYEFWLYVEVRKNKIQLPGYLNAFSTGNVMVIASYNAARWVGDNVPHIDPVKEVDAIRGMLGDTGKSLPLIDHEGAVERLGGGNAKLITQRYAKDKDRAEGLGVKPPEPPAPVIPGAGKKPPFKKKKD